MHRNFITIITLLFSDILITVICYAQRGDPILLTNRVNIQATELEYHFIMTDK